MNAQELMNTLDPTLEMVFVHLPPTVEGKTRDYWLVRDTTRWSCMTWGVGSMRLPNCDPLPGVEQISKNHCRAIKSYFDGARVRHPESYKTCACHAHIRDRILGETK